MTTASEVQATQAVIEAQLAAAANGDIPIEQALTLANAAAERAAAESSRGHPWIHPTKGWREHARQSKTNGRRKLKPGKYAEAMALRPVRRQPSVAYLDIETSSGVRAINSGDFI